MAVDQVKNFAIVTVSTGYDNDDTSIVLTTGHGAKLPDPASGGAFNLIWWNAAAYPNPADDPNVEIVRVTARSTDTLTVTRAQESTSGTNKNTGGGVYKMVLAPTKKTIDDIVADLATMFPDGGKSTGADQYIGTNDSRYLVFKTNGSNRGWWTPTGGFYVGAGGVAIGTTTFSGLFRVNKNAAPRTAFSDGMGQFVGVDTTDNHILIDTANNVPRVLFRHSGGTMASPSAAASGNYIGGMDAMSYNGSAFVTGGAIRFAADGNWVASTSYGTDVWFNLVPSGATAQVTQMVLKSTGKLGVGDTTPQPRLEVAGTENPNAGLATSSNWSIIARHINATNGNAAGIGFAVTNTDNNLTAGITGHRIGGNGQGQMRFHTKRSTTAGDPVAFAALIDEAGAMFIGDTAAAAAVTSLLELSSTTKGFLPPRMTTTQKNAITSPAEGLVVYDTTLHKLCVRVAAAWETVTSA